MRGRILLVAVTTIVLAVAAFPSAPADQQMAKLLILHDVRDDGYTYQGNPNQFAFLMLNPDGTTTTHKQGKILITQNGVKLYETLGGAAGFDGAHDYDAFNSFLFAFPTTGPYQVHAEIPNAALTADFFGEVHPVPNPVKANVNVVPPTSAQAGVAVPFTISVEDENGKILPHTDALFEVRRAADDFLLFRTHTHTHEEAMKLDYRFAEAGTYRVRVVGYNAYPDPDAPGFVPVSKDLTVQVGASTPSPGVPNVSPGIEASPAPSGKYILHATYDPDDITGPFGNMRLNAVVLDQETRTQASHVDFKATLTDPSGRVIFRSESLHEYDGNLEVITLNSAPGDYRMSVEATLDGWKGTKVFTFSVVKPTTTGAPLTPYSAGPIIVDAVIPNLISGAPSKLEFSMKNLAGAPHQHSEIDLQIHAGDALGSPLLQNKLHTHSDGKFAVLYTFPTGGDYRLVLDAESVHGDLTPSYHYKQIGGRLILPVKVTEGPALPSVPAVPAPAPHKAEDASLPAPGGFLFLLALVAAAVLARRQA